MASGDISPLKYALKYKPPVLTLLYKDEITGKLRRRSMPLRDFKASTNITSYIKELQTSQHKYYINSIPEKQLRSLLQKIRSAQQEIKVNGDKSFLSSSLQGIPPLTASSTSQSRRVDSDKNNMLAKASKSDTQDEMFQKALNELLEDGEVPQNSLSDKIPDDTHISDHPRVSKLPPLQTHKRAVNTDTLFPTDTPHDNLWDQHAGESDGHLKNDVSDYSADFNSESDKINQRSQNESSKLTASNDDNNLSLSSPTEELEDEEEFNSELNSSGGKKFDTDHVLGSILKSSSMDDLNKVSEDQLLRKKAEMDILFEANRLKPGDDGYSYNKELDFNGAKIESGWDNDSSQSSMDF